MWTISGSTARARRGRNRRADQAADQAAGL